MKYNYVYASQRFVPIGTIVTLQNLRDHSYNGRTATILQEPRQMKTSDDTLVVAYASDIFDKQGTRQFFQRDCFTIVQYPPALEAWLQSKIAYLTRPLSCYDVRFIEAL